MLRRKKDIFFRRMERIGLAVTYDDVRLKTGFSERMPDDVGLDSFFSRRVPLRVPVVSAAMDTVTEDELAIELAKCGGLGVIHRNLSPKEQAAQVTRVKYHLNGIVIKPICVHERQSIASILKTREEKRYPFHSFLVVDSAGKLVGVLTGNDFDLCSDTSLLASTVMTRQVIDAPEGTTPEEAHTLMQQHRVKLVPIVNGQHEVVALYTLSDVKRIQSLTTNNVDERGQLRVGAAIGVGKDALERAELLCAARVDVLVIDTAHADSAPVYDTLKRLKVEFPQTDVVVGNISQPESARRLLDAGADGIKVGQGGGSICTTRVVAGIGCPQVTAIYKCAVVADEFGVPVCADGGLRYSGDIPVAIGAGAHSVMLGGMLAGTKEAPGEEIVYEGRKWKKYRGMGSLGAMRESQAARERYQQGSTGKSQLVPEGIEGLVPWQGELKQLLHQYVGGLRSGMGYVGAADIAELRAKADFDRGTSAAQAESHPHDVVITQEAPNYERRVA